MVSVLDLDSHFDPFIATTIYLPENTLFYGTNKPTHYGSKKAPAAFSNPHRLHLLDLRYIQLLLKDIFNTRKDNSELEPMARVTIAYGLCSLQDQVKLIEVYLSDTPDAVKDISAYYRDFEDLSWEARPLTVNPFTPEGIRFSEPTNDALCVAFVKALFGHIADGFVAPQFDTGLGRIDAEMVLFDPQKSGIQEWPAIDLFDKLGKLTIKTLIDCQYSNRRVLVCKKERGVQLGSSTSDDIQGMKMVRFAKTVGERFAIFDPYAPQPSHPVMPWSINELPDR